MLARTQTWFARWPRLASWLLFVAVSLATRGYLLGVDILDVDEATHIVGSWELLRGRHLYVGFVDNKPPLLYVYYGVAQLLLGRGMRAVHLVTVLGTVPAIALGISSFFRHTRRGMLAGLVFLVASAAYLAHDMHAANCELLMLLPVTWALALLRDERRGSSPGWLLAAGALLGVAALLKQQALAWLPALLAAGVVAARAQRRSPWRTAGALVAGVSAPLVSAWAVFAAGGDGRAFLYWTLTYNWSYAGQPMSWGEIALRFLKYFLPFVAATVGLWVWLPRAWRKLARYEQTLLGGALVATVPIAFIGFRMYPHYFVPIYMVLALATGPFFDELFVNPFGRMAKAMLAYAAASWLGFSAANAVLYLSGYPFRWEEHQPIYRQVAEVLRADACYEGASMFSWGPGPMFVYPAGLASGSRFVGPAPTISGYVPGNWAIRDGRSQASRWVSEEHWAELMSDLAADRTTYFLDASKAFVNWRSFPLERYPRMEGFVAANYDPIATVGGVRVLRRRGCADLHPHAGENSRRLGLVPPLVPPKDDGG